MDQQLLAYIEQELKRGVRPEVIQKALCAAGWESGLVKDALAAVQSGAAAPFPQAVSAPSGEIARQNSDSLAPAATESPSKILSTAKIVFRRCRAYFCRDYGLFIFIRFFWLSDDR